ncbi:Beta-1,4-glucuronyltransferase 1 [Nymphon striatum]|nr:Beta-1,4-glucuronyltransferase 1 [Nymphon striatum]
MGASYYIFKGIWLKCVILLIIAVIVLQVVHMVLLSQLHLKTANKNFVSFQINDKPTKHKTLVIKGIQELLLNSKESSILDSSGDYRVINYFLESEVYKDETRFSRNLQDVTLTTQSSLNHIHNLIYLTSHWKGPISITIFVPDGDVNFSAYVINALRLCVPAIQKSVSFHLVHPLNEAKNTKLIDLTSAVNIKCHESLEQISSRIGKFISSKNYIHKTLYPINLLRNVARQNIRTGFFLLIDIDMVPNINLYQDFLHFLRKEQIIIKENSEMKNVYVLPAFEVRANVTFPADKIELISLIKSSNAQPFYYNLCWKCHKHTDYKRWINISPKQVLDVAYQVLWIDPWEPFYISPFFAPLYDERFKQYGFNRISQVCEMHVTGFSFAVLNNAFVIHKGMKEVTSFHKSKDEEQHRNKILYRLFKSELKEKYPNISRRCY